ncbi:hypothetical protein Lal_00038316 [Lupinus albus]|uniref:Putative gamma interferon inducible lysosomal thiol reductase GILT n=1 Tax=Lupinus albus TaxID=3870 RepID=A0A6A5N8V6_LUPAL|nr:putative gamma interferon inducible lysosomal thiol reductase GILT [Lupinus albus]KAF1883824.1 hypothetical protein Lal_00038316 [Lupinus albus]
MVSPKRACIIVLTLISFIFMCYPFGSYADNDNITAFDSEKVNVSVYYESLSIPCATFIVKNLQEFFYHEIISIVNLHLVPWANSHVNNNSIICQNGVDECTLNSLESCAINIWNVDKYYYLINCFEFLAIDGIPKNWKSCINQLGLPIEPIMNCYNRGTATELGKTYINETTQLSPPPTILPWVLVNNQPVGKEYENIISYVCKAYKGSAVPAACNLK